MEVTYENTKRTKKSNYMEITKFILTGIVEIYMVFCTIVVSVIILLWFFGRRKLKKIDKRIFQHNENNTIN